MRDLVSRLPPAQHESLQSHEIVAGQKDGNVLLHNELLKEMANADLEEYEMGNFAGQLWSCLSMFSSTLDTQQPNRFAIIQKTSAEQLLNEIGMYACLSEEVLALATA